MTYDEYQIVKEKVITECRKVSEGFYLTLTEGELNLMAEGYLKDIGVDKPL